MKDFLKFINRYIGARCLNNEDWLIFYGVDVGVVKGLNEFKVSLSFHKEKSDNN